ncbi:hypothetical protein NC653_021598 [Populus alba x Populus x berolinensis]|uniref:CCT domain-containing protein n=1 Tax=Populus alba x Populus x berolinensis TaxID=444605 RepID=A0AAD6QE37_9ROSI|nr:hypothetical protein NC653_021598 [Populus alba x Populus x berolinensis]
MKNHSWRMPKGKSSLNHSSKTSNYKDDVSSPVSDQILEFCDPEFFQETLQNSEVNSNSNCCYEDNSSCANNLPLPPDIDKYNSYQDNSGNHKRATPITTTTGTTAVTAANTHNSNSNLSIIFDSQDELDNVLSASIDFSPSPTLSVPQFISTQNDHFDFSLVQPQLTLTNLVSADGLSQYPAAPLTAHPLSSVFEEDCLSSVPSYVPLNPSSPSCSFLGPAAGAYMPAGTLNAASLSAESSGMFDGGIIMGSEWQTLELDFQGDNGGIYCPDSLQHVLNPGDLQALGNETPNLVGGHVSSAPLTSEISSLEDSTFKVGKLSVEQRREKIHRYMKKRNERNFSKKIKYACRKTLADSRPRVRGRFAKNDDFGDIHRTVCSHHEDDEDEEAVMKEEDVIDSDIFAHISGVNSFECNYSIQSWI